MNIDQGVPNRYLLSIGETKITKNSNNKVHDVYYRLALLGGFCTVVSQARLSITEREYQLRDLFLLSQHTCLR